MELISFCASHGQGCSILVGQIKAGDDKEEAEPQLGTYVLPSNALQVICMRPLTLCDNFVPFHHVHICRCCCWHFSFFFFFVVGTATNSPLPFIELYVRHTHTYVCMYEHTHTRTHTHVVVYKGQHKSETGIVTKREFDLLRIRRGCQGHPATACGAAFPYILHLKGE